MGGGGGGGGGLLLLVLRRLRLRSLREVIRLDLLSFVLLVGCRQLHGEALGVSDLGHKHHEGLSVHRSRT